MQRPRHDDLVAGLADGECERLVPMGRSADRETAGVGPPEVRRLSLGLLEPAVLEFDGVEPARGREIAGDDDAGESRGALVARRREGMLAGRSAVERCQVRPEQWRVGGEAEWIAGVDWGGIRSVGHARTVVHRAAMGSARDGPAGGGGRG